MKNKIKSKNSVKFLIILISILVLLIFISSSNPFQNLTLNQKILLAQAYYKVALYYYNNNDKQKGDAFKSVAHYLDPNFAPKDVVFSNEPLTDEEIENKIKEAKESSPKFISDFFTNKEKSSLSFPVYNLATADLFNEETIDALLEIDQIKQFFGHKLKITEVEYEKSSNLSSFLPLVYLEGDLLYVVHSEDSDQIVIILIRNFGIELKIIGFLPVEKTLLTK